MESRPWTDLLFDAARPMQRTLSAEGPSDAPYTVDRGEAIACILAVLAIVILGHHGFMLDLVVLRAVNVLMAHTPLIAVQAQLLNAEIPELLIAAGAVALWSRPGSPRFRARLVIGFLTCFPTYALARVTQHLDHRMRPLIDTPLQAIGDSTAFESARAGMTHWGSFPSDHAALLAIATVLAFTVGRRSGIFFLVLAIYVCLFRIAFGYHWPSDIAGGALLGTAVIGVALRLRASLRPLTDGVLAFAQEKPSTAAAIGFVLLAQFATGFSAAQLLLSLGHARLFH